MIFGEIDKIGEIINTFCRHKKLRMGGRVQPHCYRALMEKVIWEQNGFWPSPEWALPMVLCLPVQKPDKQINCSRDKCQDHRRDGHLPGRSA